MVWETQQSRNIKQILNNQTWMMKRIEQLLIGQEELKKQINILLLQGGPGKISISVTGESEDKTMLTFSINLPPKSAPDVVARRLTVTVDPEAGSEPTVYNLNAEDIVKEGLQGPRDANVLAELVDIDGSGNESQPSTASAQLVDTIPPPQPGELGFVITGEE